MLLVCPLYEDLRLKLFDRVTTYFPFFKPLSDSQKLSVILSYESVEIVRICAKTCHEILMIQYVDLFYTIENLVTLYISVDIFSISIFKQSLIILKEWLLHILIRNTFMGLYFIYVEVRL